MSGAGGRTGHAPDPLTGGHESRPRRFRLRRSRLVPIRRAAMPDMPQPQPAHHTGEDFVAAWHANARRLEGSYNPADEHDACGVGLIAALDGKKRRDVVQAGIDALKAVWHRGAVDADGKTGDGAGIHIEIPQDFFADAVERGGD